MPWCALTPPFSVSIAEEVETRIRRATSRENRLAERVQNGGSKSYSTRVTLIVNYLNLRSSKYQNSGGQGDVVRISPRSVRYDLTGATQPIDSPFRPSTTVETLKKSERRTRLKDRTVGNKRVGMCPFPPDHNVAGTLFDRRQDIPSAQEDHRAQFFEDYRREAEEYDKEFIKKYDEDLNTTLIFVSFLSSFGARMLTRITGWSVLRRNLGIHYRSSLPPPTRPERRDCCPSSRPHPQNRQHHLRKRPSHDTTMDGPSPHDCPGPSDPLHESRHLSLLRLPCNARETVVEPVRVD